MPHSERHQARLSMGPGAILSLRNAAALLPLDDNEAREWLQARGLVRYLSGRAVVVWADVMDALRAGENLSPSPQGAVVNLRRAKLDPL